MYVGPISRDQVLRDQLTDVSYVCEFWRHCDVQFWSCPDIRSVLTPELSAFVHGTCLIVLETTQNA
jgi:hypothetical protein